MKLSSYEIQNNIATAHIDFTKEEMDGYFTSLYKEYAPSINIPGFRKGKAPLNLLKQHINPIRFREDLLLKIGEKAIVMMLKEKNEEYIDYPKIDFKEDPVEGEPYTLTLKADLYPSVKLPEIKKSKIEVKKPSSADEIFERKLTEFLNVYATWEPIEKEPKIGDYAVIEYSQIPEKETEEEPKGNTSMIELGKNTLFPDSDEKIMKLSPGEDVTIPYKTASKEMKFKVKLISYKKKIVPELDETLLEKSNTKGTIEDFKENLKKEAEQEHEKMEEDIKITGILEYLLKESKVDSIPDNLIQSYKDMEIQEFEKSLEQSKLSLEEFLERNKISREDFEKQVTPRAENQMKVDLIIRQLHKDNPETKIDESELESKIKDFLGTYTVEEQKKINTDTLDRVMRDRIIRKNVMDYLLKETPVQFSKK